MTKRRRPKKREPWPAFTLLTAVLTVAAVLAGLLLDYISAQRGETAFLFTATPKAAAGAVEMRPAEKPVERPPEKPAPKPEARAFDEVIAASLTSAGLSEDSVLPLKGSKGRPLAPYGFEASSPSRRMMCSWAPFKPGRNCKSWLWSSSSRKKLPMGPKNSFVSWSVQVGR